MVFYAGGVLCAPLLSLRQAAVSVLTAAAAVTLYKFLIYNKTTEQRRNFKFNAGLWLLLLTFFSCALLRAGLIINDNSNDINKRLDSGAFIKIKGRAGQVKTYEKTPGGQSYSSAVITVEKYYDARLKIYKKIKGSIFIKIIKKMPSENIANKLSCGDKTAGENFNGASLSENDLIEAAGRVEKIHKYKNLYLSSNNNPLKPEILYSMKTAGENVTIINKGRSVTGCLKNKAVELFKNYFPAEISGFLIAFALGDSSETADSIYFNNNPVFDFCESGLLHIMVVSGGHLTLMIAFISAALNFLKVRHEFKTLILFIIISSYFLIIGFQAAVTRAYISFAVYIAASCLEREINHFNIFIAAMFAHIVIFPEFIFSPGFWLSYISTFAIIAAGAFKTEPFEERIYLNAVLQYCKITAAALISTYPAVCYISGYFPLNSAAANILTLWIYEALLALCLVFAACSLISSYLAWAAAAAIYHIAFAALKINEFISILPMGNIAIYKLTLIETLALYSIIALVTYAAAVKKIAIRSGALLKIAACAIVFLALRGSALKYFEGAEAIFLDTGQGDCALIKTANNKWIIIDAGGSPSSYNKVLAPYLRYRHISEIEYLIITHAHGDHYCNAINLYANRKIKIKNLYYSPCDKGEAGFNKLLKLAHNKKTIYAGGRLFTHGVSIDILWPPANGRLNEEPLDCNDSSIVAAVKINGRSLLFCGDITQKVENKLAEKLGRYNFDFIKAPHHGSITSNSENFVKTAGARGVYIPSAASNKFGHPHKTVLSRYSDSNYKIYNSQNCGGIILNISKRIKIKGVNFSGEYL